MTRRAVTPEHAAIVGPYSPSVVANNMLYVSGQTPIDPVTSALVEGSVGDQTAQCFANLFAILDAAGLDESDVVSVDVYLTDMADFAEMNETYRQQFSEPFPARTTVAVAGLPLDAAVEIRLTAALRP